MDNYHPQAKKAWKAEDEGVYGKDIGLLTLEEANAFVTMVVNSDWWDETFPRITRAVVNFSSNNGDRITVYRHWNDLQALDIYVPADLCTRSVLLEGMVEVACYGQGYQYCSPKTLQTYLLALQEFLGNNIAYSVIDSMEELQVELP